MQHFTNNYTNKTYTNKTYTNNFGELDKEFTEELSSVPKVDVFLKTLWKVFKYWSLARIYLKRQ